MRVTGSAAKRAIHPASETRRSPILLAVSKGGFGVKSAPQPRTQTPPEPCPCASGRNYKKCCGPIHAGTAKAATAEATLRARFSGFIKGKDQFIIDATHPNFLTSHYEGMTPEAAAAKYAANVHTGCTKFLYTDFKVVGTEAGTDENEAFVSLSYKSVEHAQGAPIPPADAWLVTNERCRFLRSSEKDDRWLLADSQTYDYNLTTLVADVQSEGAPTSPSAA